MIMMARDKKQATSEFAGDFKLPTESYLPETSVYSVYLVHC
jgi:hypothetical protein